MAKGKGFLHSRTFKVMMSKVYGIGAAVVILGAMFKILHVPGANYWIGIGLTTEAMIFFISSFEPMHEDPDWTLVYPELAGMDPKKKEEKKSLTQTLDKMLEEAKIEQATISRLGEAFHGLNDSVNKMKNVADAANATNAYAESIKTASASVSKLNTSFENSIAAIDLLGKSGGVLASNLTDTESRF
ncbi:MAG: gliding motility protein GldL [Bacteroidetes bacterium]|nr:gliding motility protein GldL [Bacteroidota bacterium]